MKQWQMIIWKPKKERIEAIDPDSLADAFEVIEDEIETLFQTLKTVK